MFHGENDRVKLLVLYSGMLEDERLVRAASGALAMMSHDRIVSNKITTVSIFADVLFCYPSFFYCVFFITLMSDVKWCANSFIKLRRLLHA